MNRTPATSRRLILLALAPIATLAPAASAQIGGSIVQPVSISTSYFEPFSSAGQIQFTIDRSGLSAPYTSGETDFDAYVSTTTHANSNSGMMLVNSNGLNQPAGFVIAGGTITLDLGTALDIDALGVWATQVRSELMSSVALHADADANFNNGGTTLLGTFDVPVTISGTALEFSPVRARFVHIEVLAHGGGSFLRNGEFAVRAAEDTRATVLTNLQSPIGTAATLLGDGPIPDALKAVGFTTGSDGIADLGVTAIIDHLGGIESLDLFGGVHSDAAGNPGGRLASFAPVEVPVGADQLAVTLELAVADQSFVLSPNTSYWVVLDGEDHPQELLRWLTTDPFTTPTPAPGITFDGYRLTGDGGATWSVSAFTNAVQVSGAFLEVQPCPADTNGDGVLAPNDFASWIQAFNAMSAACDQNGDGQCLPNDFSAWIANFNAGCP